MPAMKSFFKTEEIKQRAFEMHPLMFMLMGEMTAWAQSLSLPVSITDTFTLVGEDLSLKRVSSTHREGRAFDISAKGWPQEHIDDFIKFFNKKYTAIAATTASGPQLVVYHNAGTGNHFHIQINRSYCVFSGV